MPEELEGILEVFKLGNHFLEVASSPRGKDCIKGMPYKVEDQDNRGNTMKNASDVKTPLNGKDGLQEFDFIKNQRKSGDDQNREGDDEEIMLNSLAEIHPDEDFVISDEGCLRGKMIQICFVFCF